MSFVAPQITAAAPLLNPLDLTLSSLFNTNPYFIGITMLLLNLGGRFLAMEVTKEQEKFFQNTWVRAILVFVVSFVATRNVIVAFWLSLFIIIMLRFLFNENSDMYLFKSSVKNEQFQTGDGTAAANVLSPEEADIYRKLTDKLAKSQPSIEEKNKKDIDILQIYTTNMSRVQD